ncbi:MAG: hypothetical protein NZ903_01310 [Candidatus Micrarchaeota archaeon]|nr:hypothetical protein [Candidatus Micrarchaeota archaeon]
MVKLTKIRKEIIFFILILLIAVIIVSFSIKSNFDKKEERIKLAAWNVHFFGDKKSQNVTLLEQYAQKIQEYDLIILQEIVDADGSAFYKLCEMLKERYCILSSRAGRTNYKEQHGIIFDKRKIKINDIRDFNPDLEDRWERPPIALNISVNNGKWIVIYTIHVKPRDAEKEISNLEALLSGLSYPVLIIGDLNADCAFYNTSRKHFENWIWVIGDDEDTTVGPTNCAYDRIIINEKMMEYYNAYGIDKNITKELSDHYLIWIELKLV